MRPPKEGSTAFPLGDHVPEGQNRMTEHHPGPGKSHDPSDLLPHLRFVAVDPALTAYRFVFPEETFLDSLFCIGAEIPAAFAKRLPATMPVAAIHADHDPDRFDLPLHSFHPL